MKNIIMKPVLILMAIFVLVFSGACGKAQKTAEENLAEADQIMARINASGESDPALIQRAEQCYGRAFQKDPKSPRAAYGLGMARARGRNFGQAIEDFNQAVALDPNNPEIYYRRALCRVANPPGDKAAALADLEKTLALNPKHLGATRMKRLLSGS